MEARPFRILGVQQIAIGALDRGALEQLWVELFGVEKHGEYKSEAENVDESILVLGTPPFSVEIDLMQPIDPTKRPKVHQPALNHIGLWVDSLDAAVSWLKGQGVRFTPGGIRKGAAGHDVCFIHPKGSMEAPNSGVGVLIELVQAPPALVERVASTAGPSARGLYPPLEPFNAGRLTVTDGHDLYYEECGDPRGKPVIFLHGGPGGGCADDHRRFFDPTRYRIVLVDQRGSGRSTPHAGLESNTTWDLVEDTERLRRHLGVERWMVFGGSWGSTLALAYAQTHPTRVTELVLRGIFMARPKELRWFYQEGASHLYPDQFAAFLDHIPEDERHDLLNAYHRRLTAECEQTQRDAARRWAAWEISTSTLRGPRGGPPEESISREDDLFAAALARIECHYFVNGGFFQPRDQLLNNIDVIRDIPGVIVQGRHDVVCPLETAYELACAWPEADFQIIEDAGHSALEPGIISALVKATDHFAEG
jgi:proline iminopeptidase